jgi:hypothetical protein
VATCHESYGDADDECHAKRSEHLLGSVIDPPCENILHVLKAELDARIAALGHTVGHTGSWPASLALRAAGVALPPTVQALAAH